MPLYPQWPLYRFLHLMGWPPCPCARGTCQLWRSEAPSLPGKTQTAGHRNVKGAGKGTHVTTRSGWTQLKMYQNRIWNKIYIFFSSETTQLPTEDRHKSIKTWSPNPGAPIPKYTWWQLADKTMESTREAVPDMTEQMGNYFRSGKCCGGRARRDTLPPPIEKGGEHSHDFHSSNMIAFLSR